MASDTFVQSASSAPEGLSAPQRRRPLGKSLLLWTRTLHIYVTMFGLILLIFFSFTGFLLNNSGLYPQSENWFNLSDPSYKTDRTMRISPALLAGKEHLIGIEQDLRKAHGARGELEGIPDEDDSGIHFQFTGPGRRMDYDIAKPTGVTKMHEEGNILALLTDLHTGEHAGRWWPWVIDAVAVFLFFAAGSGLVLWLSLPKRRRLGIVALVVSAGLCVGVYFWLVP